MLRKWPGSIFLAVLTVLGLVASSETPCAANRFRCGNGQCIDPFRRCDGIMDCLDGTDEERCHDSKCEPPSKFRCADGKMCLDATQVCDQIVNCLDRSDEPTNCDYKIDMQCSTDEFTCANKECIQRSWMCDGRADCTDGSDETTGCLDKIDCSDGFRCKNKHCIVAEFHCDGMDDCGDNSDEESCPTIFHSPDRCPVDEGFFLCKDRIVCIEEKNVCDGFPHCFDKSDEEECSTNRKLNATYCRSLGCSHGCHLAPHDRVNCTCNKGYKLAKDMKTCVDLDECQEFGYCHQKCKNLNGSYECSCDDGYSLQPDMHSCKALGGEALLLFSSYNKIRGLYLTSQEYFTVASKLNHVIGVSHSGHHVYWTDISHGEVSIIRATESGNEMEILVNSGLGMPEDLAVDYVTNNIYFTDNLKKHIGVCVDTGMLCAVLNNEDIDKPRGIALYPQKGLMYWTDWGKVPMIATSGMDGSDPRPLVSEQVQWPNGLTLDISNDRLYWVDAKAYTIETVRLDGSDRQVVLRQSVKHPFSIAIFEDMLYWSDWKSKEIQRCNKFTGKNHTSIVREKKQNIIHGIHIYHSVLYPRVENPCKEERCSHICLLSPKTSYACACPQDSVLGRDLHTCRTMKKLLQVAIGGKGKVILLSPLHLGRQTSTEINLPHVDTIGCMTYDSLAGDVILSDSEERKIYKFNLHSREVSVLIHHGLGHVSSMSFDSYGNNLYITDIETRRVDVWSMDKSKMVTLYKTYGGDIPESVVVIPEHGILFLAISRANGEITITRMNMDGTHVIPHIVGDQIHGPKVSLSYDKVKEKVYWSDSDANTIESMNIDGTERNVVVAADGTPISVAARSGYVLWVKRNAPELYMYDANGEATEFSLVFEHVFTLPVHGETYLNLAIVGEMESRKLHPCQQSSECSHVCLVSGSRGSCFCPLGMHLKADNRTCVSPAHCTNDQFKCRSDDICIAKIQRCDGHADCPSGEDERDCNVDNCGENQFKCLNGQCISAEKKCDSEYDCSDLSDEKFCVSNCSEYEFQCGSGECIPNTLRCDNAKDCKDSSDENGCSEMKCPETMFMCRSGACIPGSWECDGMKDCPDGSDEHGQCVSAACRPTELKCNNGRCVSLMLTCDGMDDCGDNTDELTCEKETTLTCGYKEIFCEISKDKCVPEGSRCNGTAECRRGEDEMGCSNCHPEDFQCRNKKCIPKAWVCDKTDDCADDSDEDPVMCSRVIPAREAITSPCEEFRCRTGECIPLYLACNEVENCPDGSDEGGSCDDACKDSHCQQKCSDTPVGGRCSCYEGYVLKSDGFTCQDVDECAEQRCSQLCNNTEGSFVCSCLPDYLLKFDRLSCKALGEPLSYVLAGDDEVRRISHDLHHVEFLLHDPGSQISGIELDTRRGLFYWSTGTNRRINVLSLDGKEKASVIVAGQPRKLSYDWTTGNVYYVDASEMGGVKACLPPRKKCAEIVHGEEGYVVSDLLFNPISGVLYYARVEPSMLSRPVAEIMEYSVLEGNSTVLAKGDISWVSGFTFDYVRRYLFWCDLYHETIEKIRFDGKERQIVLKAEVHRPVSLTFFEDSLYWLRKDSGEITKCKLYGDHRGSCQSIPFYYHDMKLLAILQEARQPNISNPCRERCHPSALCVKSPEGPKCICEDGSLIAEEEACDESQMKLSRMIARFSAGSSKQFMGHERMPISGNSTTVIGILMTALIICTVFSLYLYIKKRRSRVVLETMTFQNLSDWTHHQSPYHPSELTPGEHQYENPTLVKHPDGNYGVIMRTAKEADAKANYKLNIHDEESEEEHDDRIDMKANLLP